MQKLNSPNHLKKLIGSHKRILIKTYLHQSGIWYLAQSLGRELESLGCSVALIPKSKFIKSGKRWRRAYLPNEETSSYSIYKFKTNKPLHLQVLQAIKEHRATLIVSLETLMEDAAWISKVKRSTDVQIFDVPMLEWVSPNLLSRGSYRVFDQIWALTNSTYQIFHSKEPLRSKKVTWDYVDRKLFFPIKKKEGEFVFYHQASLNTAHSTKNTEKVIKAFQDFSQEFEQTKLIISGNLSVKELKKIDENDTNIQIISGDISRSEIAKIYKSVHCVIAPSSKEGLGLSLYEAQAAQCSLVTTDAAPMNEVPKAQLCKVEFFKKDSTLVPAAIVSTEEILSQIRIAYLKNQFRE